MTQSVLGLMVTRVVGKTMFITKLMIVIPIILTMGMGTIKYVIILQAVTTQCLGGVSVLSFAGGSGGCALSHVSSDAVLLEEEDMLHLHPILQLLQTLQQATNLLLL